MKKHLLLIPSLVAISATPFIGLTSCKSENDPKPTPPGPTPQDNFLKFTAVEDGAKIGYTKDGEVSGYNLQYTRNLEEPDWTNWTIDTYITLGQDESIYVRNTSSILSIDNDNYLSFTTGDEDSPAIAASGNVMSMLNYGSLYKYCFSCLFMNCYSLVKAPDLPETQLAENCYWEMFGHCHSLTVAPYLPATKLQYKCYMYMFYDCISLNEIKIAYTGDIPDSELEPFLSWVEGVQTNKGTFYYNGTSASYDITSGVPMNWDIMKF